MGGKSLFRNLDTISWRFQVAISLLPIILLQTWLQSRRFRRLSVTQFNFHRWTPQALAQRDARTSRHLSCFIEIGSLTSVVSIQDGDESANVGVVLFKALNWKSVVILWCYQTGNRRGGFFPLNTQVALMCMSCDALCVYHRGENKNIPCTLCPRRVILNFRVVHSQRTIHWHYWLLFTTSPFNQTKEYNYREINWRIWATKLSVNN